MVTETADKKHIAKKEIEYSTFYLGDLLIGIDIQRVQEINQQLEVTPVPHAPEYVFGVVNLRGEVVTILDLRKILGLANTEITARNRNVIVNADDVQVGLLVDRIADVVIAKEMDIEQPPANIKGIDGRFFHGVYKLEKELLVILNVQETVACREEA